MTGPRHFAQCGSVVVSWIVSRCLQMTHSTVTVALIASSSHASRICGVAFCAALMGKACAAACASTRIARRGRAEIYSCRRRRCVCSLTRECGTVGCSPRMSASRARPSWRARRRAALAIAHEPLTDEVDAAVKAPAQEARHVGHQVTAGRPPALQPRMDPLRTSRSCSSSGKRLASM